MEVKMMPTVKARDLEEAIKIQYDLDLYIPDVLFCGDFQNDCYLEYEYKDTARMNSAPKRKCVAAVSA